MNPELGLFFTGLGLRILQGYGQTETAPLISVNRPSGPKMHTVGPPVDNTEVRIADDGEIVVRGDLVMAGYWRNDEATAEVIRDGWIFTGDIGVFDDDGHLMITDRKKDIIVNSGGDNIAPQRVEGILTLEPEIAQAMVYGDQRPHLVALLVPDPDWLAELTDKSDIHKAIGAAVERVNASLSAIERIRRFIVIDVHFTIANEMMTPTMKIRRHKILKIHGDALIRLYG